MPATESISGFMFATLGNDTVCRTDVRRPALWPKASLPIRFECTRELHGTAD